MAMEAKKSFVLVKAHFTLRRVCLDKFYPCQFTPQGSMKNTKQFSSSHAVHAPSFLVLQC